MQIQRAPQLSPSSTSSSTLTGVAGMASTVPGSIKWQSPLLQNRLATQSSGNSCFRNEALQCAASIMRSEAARVDGRLCEDFGSILRGNTVYIRRFVSDEDDFTLYNRLKEELVAATGAKMSLDGGLIEWSRHQIFENPTGISPVFNEIIEMLAEYFDIDVYATRLNYYRDGQQWKPQHHDSHAYGNSIKNNGNKNGEGEKMKEDFTVGITLGATRSLLFIHESSGHQFEFPQRNGECFAFTDEVNTTFTHGVPRVNTPIGDRFSIIAWGRRRSLNERNGGRPSETVVRLQDGREVQTVEDAIRAAQQLVSRSTTTTTTNNNVASAGVAKKKKKNRLQ